MNSFESSQYLLHTKTWISEERTWVSKSLGATYTLNVESELKNVAVSASICHWLTQWNLSLANRWYLKITLWDRSEGSMSPKEEFFSEISDDIKSTELYLEIPTFGASFQNVLPLLCPWSH